MILLLDVWQIILKDLLSHVFGAKLVADPAKENICTASYFVCVGVLLCFNVLWMMIN